MNTINAQTIINDLRAAHAVAPIEASGYITFRTSERGTHRIVNDQAHIKRFAELVRKNASAFGGGLIREGKTRPAVSYSPKTISLYKQLIEDQDWFAALQLAEEKLSPLFFMDKTKGSAYMQVAPIPLESDTRFVSAMYENGKWSVGCPLSGMGIDGYIGCKRSRDAQINAANQYLRTKKEESIAAAFAKYHATPADQSTIRAQWMAEHGIVDDATIEARIEAQAAQDVAEVVAQAVATAAIADAMATTPEAVEQDHELVTCEAGESESVATTCSMAHGASGTVASTPHVAVSTPSYPVAVSASTYHSDKMAHVTREYGLSIAEVREIYDTDAAVSGDENEWVESVMQYAKDGGALSSEMLDNLHAVRPGAVGKLLHDYPDAAIPNGYTPPAESTDTLPAGWTESAPGRLATSEDQETGGIVDTNIVTGKWFAISNATSKQVPGEFSTRAEAIAAITQATAPEMGKQPEPVAPVVGTESTTANDTARFNIRAKSGAWCAFVFMLDAMYGLRFEAKGCDPVSSTYATHAERMQALEAMAMALYTPPEPPQAVIETEQEAETDAQEPATPSVENAPTAPSVESVDEFQRIKPFNFDPRKLLEHGVQVEQLIGLGVKYTGNMESPDGYGAIISATDTRTERFGDLKIICTLEDGRVIHATPNYFTADLRPILQFNGKFHGAPYLAQLAGAAAMAKSQRTSAEEMRKQAHAQALIDMAAKYPQLKLAAENPKCYGGTMAAKNIRILLKDAFNGVKFSVTSDYSKVSVLWTDGPTDAQVKGVIGQFETGHSDSQTDYFYTKSTAFSELFGGVEFLLTTREVSDALVQEAINQLYNKKDEKPTVNDYRKCVGIFDWDGRNYENRRMRETLASISKA